MALEVDTQHGTSKYKIGSLSPVAVYLTRAQVEKYRIRFFSGSAQMHDRKTYTKWVPADSRGIGWKYAPGVTDQMMEPGYAGFALSVERDLYMAHHRGGSHKDDFFHSSYLSGDSVLCTGTMLIVNGIVKGVKNDRGHCQPSIEHLVDVAEMLEMHGVNISNVQFTAVKYSWRDENSKPGNCEVTCTGTELLALRGGGRALKERVHFNQKNVASRGGAQGLGAVAVLPPPVPPLRRPMPPPPKLPARNA